MIKRILEISNFKNIGIDDKASLLINYDVKTSGDLLILIGPNNSGKSNVLSALNRLSTKQFENNDTTEISLLNDKITKYPTIKLIYENRTKNSNIPHKLHAELNQDGLLISREDNNGLIEEIKTFKEKIESLDKDEINNDSNVLDVLQKITNKTKYNKINL